MSAILGQTKVHLIQDGLFPVIVTSGCLRKWFHLYTWQCPWSLSEPYRGEHVAPTNGLICGPNPVKDSIGTHSTTLHLPHLSPLFLSPSFLEFFGFFSPTDSNKKARKEWKMPTSAFPKIYHRLLVLCHRLPHGISDALDIQLLKPF